MACDLYCCRFGRFPRVVLIATLKGVQTQKRLTTTAVVRFIEK